MRSYRQVFQVPEFPALFCAATVQTAAWTVSALGRGSLVFAATGSALLAALGVYGPALVQVFGATLFMSAADRLPPRAALCGVAVVFAVGTGVQTIPRLPVWVVFAVIAVIGLVASVGSGVRYGLLHEILPPDGYLLGRSVLNMAVGVTQVAGFAIGGLLVATVSPRGALAVGAGLYVLAATVARTGLTRRPARTDGRPSVRHTWRNNAILWESMRRRYVFLALWIPNGLIVGCEALFVSYSPRHAGLLFAFAALGMLIGDGITGRFVPALWRARLAAPLRLALAAPYLVFVLHPSLPVALAAVTVSSIGYSASLLLQEQLLQMSPADLSGHASGLATAGAITMQGVGAASAGTIAQLTSPATAMTTVAVASIVVTLALAPGLLPTLAARATDTTETPLTHPIEHLDDRNTTRDAADPNPS